MIRLLKASLVLAFCFHGASCCAQAYPLYGPYGMYRGFYNANPHNGSYQFYSSHNVYQGRLDPGVAARYQAYNGLNMYQGSINTPHITAQQYQNYKSALRADYMSRHPGRSR
jgi:hypothetical protein